MTSEAVRIGVAVPIRAFDGGKARLAPQLDRAERARLYQSMADRVVDAAEATAGLAALTIVSSAPEVVRWARGRGLDVLPDPGTLDGAADAGRRHLAADAVDRVVVVHADLPMLTDLSPVTTPGRDPVVVAVPCRHDDGTPVLSLPATADFCFAYGPGSFRRHVAEAQRLGLHVVERRDDDRLRHDVDSVDDLAMVADLVALDGGQSPA
ncbi:MAG TPA: 2-phospho-L-lactate guanylyltransferase [Acidimicrobiia bacterium]|nr:2-phospho-L-lactate guanylyltransferase [Acidimicrobiia bacterium]